MGGALPGERGGVRDPARPVGRLSEILRRIRREVQGKDPLTALRQLSPRDLQSLLLHVFAQRDGGVGEALNRFQALPACRPSPADARALNRAEAHCYDAASEFEAITLPPVVPLGATRALGGTHQNNVLSCLRGLEVGADPTTWLALECASRLRSGAFGPVRLCCSQRVIRMQPVPPPLLPHFQIFAAVSEDLREHCRLHLDVWRRLAADPCFEVGPVCLELSDPVVVRAMLESAGVGVAALQASIRAHDVAASRSFLEERGLRFPRGRGLRLAGWQRRLDRLEEVLSSLEAEFPEVELAIDLSRLEGLAYYNGPTLRVWATAGNGARFAVADGGYTDWLARLLDNRRQRFFSSGLGLTLPAAVFLRR